MIFGIVGEGGTGKSALTVDMCIEHLTKYDIIYTNIKGFNKNHSIEDIADNLSTEIDIRTFENSSDDFVAVLNAIEVMQSENSNDEKFKILVMYDECHKALRTFTATKDDPVYISDFLSESRHAHVDFYFLTQGYKKIAEMYKGEFKAWYISVDDQFKNSPDNIEFKKMDKDCTTKIGIKRFSKSKKYKGKSGNLYTVFDCYDSGDDGKKQQKQGLSILLKRKLIFLGILIFTIVAFIYSYFSVSSTLSTDNNITKSSSTHDGPNHSQKKDSNSIAERSYTDRFDVLKENLTHTDLVAKFVTIDCLYDVKRSLYIFKDRVLTKKNFEALNELFLFEILNTQILSENVYRYEYLVDAQVLTIIQPNVQGAKQNSASATNGSSSVVKK